MRQRAKQGARLGRILCPLGLAFACVALAAPAAVAKPLDKPSCDALKSEHHTLLESGLKAEIARGHQWAKDNLGQLKLQKISRLFEIEEHLAFRCKGTGLKTAVVIPSLRAVVPAAKAPVTQTQGVRRSAVPVPVKRPALNQAKGTTRPTTAPRLPKATLKAKVGPPVDAKAELPKVIRLQKPKSSAPNTARRAKARRTKARQVKARKARQRRRRSDAYVPPPANPGYQPSLGSP